MASMRSRVHPKHKTRYRLRNWAAYDRALTARGDVTLWLAPEAIAEWNSKPTGRRCGQQKYSDLAIRSSLTIRSVFHLPLRQTEGFVRSILRLTNFDLTAPNHSSLSRRGSALEPVLLRPKKAGPVHVIVDSTGLPVSGQGEWAAAKQGERGRRGWIKLHIGVHRHGGILAHRVTEDTVDDATTAIGIFHEIKGDFATATGDRAYDTRPFYAAAEARDARVMVSPTKNASCDGPGLNGRNGTVRRVQEIGPRLWKKESGYHSQSKAENCFFRFKTIFGDRLRSRSLPAQRSEVAIACNAFAVMTSLGMPDSYTVRL